MLHYSKGNRKDGYGKDYGKDYGEGYGEDNGEDNGEGYGEDYGEGYGKDYDAPFDDVTNADSARALPQAAPAPESEYDVSFDDVYGYESIKQALRRIIDMSCNAGKYTALGARMPHGIVLYGEPGVGKTMMAQAMMHEMHRPAYILRKVQADNAFMQLISNVFAAAKENAPSVILLDDLDKFSNGRGVTEEYAAVQAGIDSVKGSNVFVIATVNEMTRLPGALYRSGRFDRRINIPVPCTEDAALIIGKCLEGKKVAKDLNMKAVAKILDGHTSAALDTVLNEAGMYAGFAGKDEIGLEDIVQAVLSEVYDIDGMAVIPPEEKLELAYHEAGHAAAEMLFEPGSVAIASVCGSGKTGPRGFVKTLRKSRETYASSCSKITATLAGRAAIELRFADIDMGACQDILDAGRICDRLIMGAGAKGLAYSIEEHYEESDNTTNSGNLERTRMLEDHYREAKVLLHKNWALVESIAQALFKKETLICDDLDAIYADYISSSGKRNAA